MENPAFSCRLYPCRPLQIFLLGVLYSHRYSHACSSSIEVYNTDDKSLSGFYRLLSADDLICHGYRVWQKGALYFYRRLEGDWDGWVVGNSSCANIYYKLQGFERNASSPDKVSSTWQEKDDYGNWNENIFIDVYCGYESSSSTSSMMILAYFMAAVGGVVILLWIMTQLWGCLCKSTYRGPSDTEMSRQSQTYTNQAMADEPPSYEEGMNMPVPDIGNINSSDVAEEQAGSATQIESPPSYEEAVNSPVIMPSTNQAAECCSMSVNEEQSSEISDPSEPQRNGDTLSEVIQTTQTETQDSDTYISEHEGVGDDENDNGSTERRGMNNPAFRIL